MILIDEIVDGERFLEIILTKRELKNLDNINSVRELVDLDGNPVYLAIIIDNDIRKIDDYPCHQDKKLTTRRKNGTRRNKTSTNS